MILCDDFRVVASGVPLVNLNISLLCLALSPVQSCGPIDVNQAIVSLQFSNFYIRTASLFNIMHKVLIQVTSICCL